MTTPSNTSIDRLEHGVEWDDEKDAEANRLFNAKHPVSPEEQDQVNTQVDDLLRKYSSDNPQNLG